MTLNFFLPTNNADDKNDAQTKKNQVFIILSLRYYTQARNAVGFNLSGGAEPQ